MVENIHQNHIGTMANALAYYAVMTERSPFGLPMRNPYLPEIIKLSKIEVKKIQTWPVQNLSEFGLTTNDLNQ